MPDDRGKGLRAHPRAAALFAKSIREQLGARGVLVVILHGNDAGDLDVAENVAAGAEAAALRELTDLVQARGPRERRRGRGRAAELELMAKPDDYERVTFTRRRHAVDRSVSERCIAGERFHVELEQMRREMRHRLELDLFEFPLERVVVEHPASWWQGLKQVLRRRWPRLFRRLRVVMVRHELDAAILMPMLPPLAEGYGRGAQPIVYPKRQTFPLFSGDVEDED
jgi:hypothetical protein